MDGVPLENHRPWHGEFYVRERRYVVDRIVSYLDSSGEAIRSNRVAARKNGDGGIVLGKPRGGRRVVPLHAVRDEIMNDVVHDEDIVRWLEVRKSGPVGVNFDHAWI